MKRNKNHKYYDVKTFLNKKKNGSRFLFLTFGNKNAGVLPLVSALIIVAIVSYKVIPAIKIRPELIGWGLNTASPILNFDIEKKFIKKEKILVSVVSPLICLNEDFKVSKEKGKAKNIIPQIDIKDETVYTNGVEIKNETDFTVEPLSLLVQGIQPIPSNPKVLIVHTHGSESYTPDKRHSYNHNGNYRTQNTNYNVIRVGDELRKALESKGIEVIHDKTINDFPSYNDSYNKTGEIIKKHINNDKDIAFVFDIHRDAVGTPDGIVKFTTKTKGLNTAQVMIVCGSDANLENPLWMENFKLAVHIQDYFTRNYPGFLRPVNLRKERFNMHLTTGSLLFEVGTNGNTLEEALNAAKILGEGLGDFVNILKNS